MENLRRHESFMLRAIALSREGILARHGGPFGAVIVRQGKIVGQGYNCVIKLNDPTAHGEITAIRDAGKNVGNPWLEGCTLYTSCQPCPMCLGATMWSHINQIFYAATEEDAATIGFDDANFYKRMGFNYRNVQISMDQLLREEAVVVMQEWKAMKGRHY